jgi:hypothetical protein
MQIAQKIAMKIGELCLLTKMRREATARAPRKKGRKIFLASL